MASAYQERLHKEAPDVLKVVIPSVCHGFDKILRTEEFNKKSRKAATQAIKDGCKSLMDKKLRLVAAKNDEIKRKRRRKRKFKGKVRVGSLTQPGTKKRKIEESSLESMSSSGGSESAPVHDSDDESDDELAVLQGGGNQEVRRAEIEISNAINQLQVNPVIGRMEEQLKPLLVDILESCLTVRTWLKLLTPKMQDGNNFGVEVQNAIIEFVKRLETESSASMQALSIYHLTRAEMMSKLSKYPGILDYSRALEELDEKEFIQLRILAVDMRNNCYALLDMFNKNIDKIKNPRSNKGTHNMLCY